MTDSSWTSCTYPIQSCAEYQGQSVPTMTSNLEEKAPELLPKSIRAVRDSHTTGLRGRNLVICLDGTGDKFDNDNSNVVQFVACLKKDDLSQVTYYQSGIGTYDGRGLSKGFSAALDMAVGSGLGIHIKDAYRFIMQNYKEGDKICLLGFSRGSYAVRCLAGMLHKVGLLPAHNRAQVHFAYKFYKDDTPEGWKMSAEFKRAFCINVTVYFIGIWDCVASVGFIPRKLPFSKSPTNTIKYFRHAMALDEHRAKFNLSQYQQENPAAAQSTTADETPKAEAKKGLHKIFNSASKANSQARPKINSKFSSMTSQSKESKDEKQALLESEFEKKDHTSEDHEHVKPDVLEVWFTGAHADVGGGAVANEERHMLSRIPLRWMIRQCFECDTGILFSTRALSETGIDVPTVWPIYKTRTQPIVGPSPSMVERYEAGDLPPIRRRSTAFGLDKKQTEKVTQRNRSKPDGMHPRMEHPDLLLEHVEDHFDAMAPINDQLIQAKRWWMLEFWPIKVRIQRKEGSSEKQLEEEGNWQKVLRCNMGRYRAVREAEPRIHWTVQMRMGEKGYKVRSRMDKDAVWQVSA